MNRKWIGITVALALALIVFLYGKEKGWFKKKASTGEDVPPAENPPPSDEKGTPPIPPGNKGTGTERPPKNNPGTGTTTKPGNFNADEQARNVHKLLANWFDYGGEDDKAFDIIGSYSDNQLKEVAKAWSKIYLFGNGNFSLYQMVDAEVVNGRPSVMDKKIKILEKMRRLGVDKIQ